MSPTLEKSLKQMVTFQKKDVELGTFFPEFAKEHRLPILVDARLDPTFRLTMNVYKLPLEEGLDRTAQLAGARAVLIGDVIYIGPKQSAERASTSAAIIRAKLEGAADKKNGLLKTQQISWKGEETAATILPQLAREIVFDPVDAKALIAKPIAQISNVAKIDAVLGLLAQCDLTLSLDEKTGVLSVMSLPAAPVCEWIIQPVSETPAEFAAKARNSFPQLQVEPRESDVLVRGSYADIRALRKQNDATPTKSKGKQKRPKRTRNSSSKGAAPRFSLDLNNVTLESFVESVKETTGKSVSVDEKSLDAAGKSKLDRISCSVKNLTTDEIFDTALKPIGLRHRIDDGRYIIYAERR